VNFAFSFIYLEQEYPSEERDGGFAREGGRGALAGLEIPLCMLVLVSLLRCILVRGERKY